MDQMKIRPARVPDVEDLIRHRRMMWSELGCRDKTALDLMEAAARQYFPAAIAEGSYRGFLAEHALGTLLGGGGIAISPWPGVLGQAQPRRATILNVYVEPEHRRKGVARALLATMIAWCKANQFAHVSLHASEAGRSIYERLGFKATDEMRLDLS
jgi:GNAT superfamily N-acetyltransferase